MNVHPGVGITRSSTKVKIAYGDFLRRFGLREDAIAILRDATRMDPDSTLARVRLADVLLTKGTAEEVDEARKLVKVARERAPGHPDGLVLAAKIELIDRRPQEAHDLLLEALAQRPRDAGALYYFGLSLVRLKRVAEARGPLERAIGFDPEMAPARLLRARIELTEGYLAYREHQSEAAATSRTSLPSCSAASLGRTTSKTAGRFEWVVARLSLSGE